MKFLFTILFFFIVFVSYSQNFKYYISNTGNDANSIAQARSSATPWQTITKVNSFFSSLQPGDTIAFKSGDTFSGSIIASRSGLSGLPIIITSYGSGAKPIITGMTTASAWTNLGSNIWETTSAISTLSFTNMVTIANVNTPMGRIPNTGYYYYQSHTGNTSITSSNLTGTPNWTGAQLALFEATYTIGRNPITAQSGGTLTYTPSSQDQGIQFDGQGFIIQADPRTLDIQNEWYYNPTTKKLQIYSTSSPTSVKIATIDSLVYIAGYNYITFNGISFSGANTYAAKLSNAKFISFLNCDFEFIGKDGINGPFSGNSTGAKIENCSFNHVNNCSVRLESDFDAATLRYNTVRNTGTIFGMMSNGGGVAIGLYANGANSLFEYNDLDSMGYNGINFWGSNSIVRYNYVRDFCYILSDGGGIYTYNGYPNTVQTGMKIYNNIVLNSTNPAIYTDDHSNGIEIYNNTSANCERGLYMHNNFSINSHNNTTYNNSLAQFLIDNNDGTLTTNVAIRNNIFFSKTSGQYTGWFVLLNGTISSTFTPDSNYYARPIDDNLTILTNFNGVYTDRTLATWQTVSNRDLHSKKSPKTITTTNDLRFEYNETSVSKTVSLPGIYIDVYNTPYNGSITLQPYSSAVLIYSAASTLPLSATSSATAITCNGGTSTVTVTGLGGVPPYTGTGTFTGVTAGTHSYTVTDAQSTIATTSVTITQPTGITITEGHTTIGANGGTSTVTITASGGTGTLSYKIGSGSYQSSNSFTGVIAGTYTVTVRDANLCTNTITFTITQPTALLVSASAPSITCNNGSTTVTVTASGGTLPYQYKIGAGSYQGSSVFTGVTAGTYTLTVLDGGGAITSTSITLTNPTPITISLAFGVGPTTVVVTASGGVGSYEYQLDGGSYQTSNTFLSVAVGNHTMVVRDAPLCGFVKAFTVISAGTPLAISASSTNATCNGGNGSVTIGASGGTAPYTGTGVFAQAAGTHLYTVTDNASRTHDTTITITQPAVIAIGISTGTIVTNGGNTTVTITPSGGVPAYTYNLDGAGYVGSGSYSGILAGNHSITVKDANNCTSTATFVITQPGVLQISVSPSTISCYGDNSSVTISGSGGTAPLTVTGGSPQSKAAGTYTFSVTDAFGAVKDTIVTISQPTQVSVIQILYPAISTNGGTTTVTVSATGGTGTITYKLDGGSYQGSNSFSSVSGGNHTAYVKDGNNCVNSQQFTIGQPSSSPTGYFLKRKGRKHIYINL